jgi:hypothetical protein
MNFLEMKVWFDEFEILTPSYEQIPVDSFIAGGKRWWDALNRGDSRTASSGIMPLSENKKPES